MRIYLALFIFIAIQKNAVAAECGNSDVFDNQAEPIPFQTIPMVDPKTGYRYHPHDPIKIHVDDEHRVIKAEEYFRQLNELEESLNQRGFSIRQSGEHTISGWTQCLAKWEAQADKIKKEIRASLAEFLLKESDWAEAWDDIYTEYQKNRPSWAEIQRLAESSSYQVHMPEVPVFSVSKPKFQRKDIAFQKEKSWPWEGGDKGKAYVGFYPYIKLGVDKLEAKGEAGFTIDGGLAGQWNGNIAAAAIHTYSPASGPLKVDVVASVIDGRKTWNKPLVDLGSLRYEDEIRSSLSKAVTYNFQLGPIPMSAELGIRGSMGLRYGLDLYPLQVGSYVQAYAAADAYAQVGADIYIAAVGVGGHLRIIEFSLPLQGHALFDWQEEPLIHLTLSATTDLNVLSGDLYAYAKVDYLFDTWKGKYPFFVWSGFRKAGTIIDYQASLSRAGLVAKGDLSPDDLLEKTYVNRQARLEALEEQAELRRHETLLAIAKDLQSVEAMDVSRREAKIQHIAKAHDATVDHFMQQLEDLLQ